jgi:hypothetical protein
MKSGCKTCWTLILILALGLGLMAYTFLIRGNVEMLEDGRTAVLLTADERTRVLGEMRGLLETVQTVIVAATEGDMQTIAEASTRAGMAAAEGESPQLIGKLPLEFKTLGLGTHAAFDDLAELAGTTDEPMVVIEELGAIMNNCVFCHQNYRLGIEDTGTME